MKRIVRLTESDLIRLVKRVINEEETLLPPQDLSYGEWVESIKTRLSLSKVKYIEENKTWSFDEVSFKGKELYGYVKNANWSFLPDPKFEILNFKLDGAETINMDGVGYRGLDVGVGFEIQRKGVGTFIFYIYLEKSTIMSSEEEESLTNRGKN
jgi:hypothetical protein